MMLGPDEADVDEFVHAMIERHRKGDESFAGEVSQALAIALVSSTFPNDPRSPEGFLLRLREWYGPSFERRSVLTVMQHFKGSTQRSFVGSQRRCGRTTMLRHARIRLSARCTLWEVCGLIAGSSRPAMTRPGWLRRCTCSSRSTRYGAGLLIWFV